VTGSFQANLLLRGRAAETSNILRDSRKLVLEELTHPKMPALALPAERRRWTGGGISVIVRYISIAKQWRNSFKPYCSPFWLAY
jgi:hypothetical protein